MYSLYGVGKVLRPGGELANEISSNASEVIDEQEILVLLPSIVRLVVESSALTVLVISKSVPVVVTVESIIFTFT